MQRGRRIALLGLGAVAVGAPTLWWASRPAVLQLPAFDSIPSALRTLASLNHPNIAQIYGIEESTVQGPMSNVRALVMELVEGEDLSEILARGPVPLADALPIARQIAAVPGAPFLCT